MSTKHTPIQLWHQLGWIRMHSRLPLTPKQVQELQDAEDHLRSYQYVLDAAMPPEAEAVATWLAEQRPAASPEAEAFITQSSLLIAAVRGLQGLLDERTKTLEDTRRELEREKHLHNYYYQSREGFQQHCVDSANKFADERDEVKRELAETQTQLKEARAITLTFGREIDQLKARLGNSLAALRDDKEDSWGTNGPS